MDVKNSILAKRKNQNDEESDDFLTIKKKQLNIENIKVSKYKVSNRATKKIKFGGI